ncbi:hypothetical protein F4553_000514 [Allocatelliglobosispora scoriae]|uniref:CATRA-Associated Small Protein domain-containing protein n=1 Tax=Allocatelliglobosispora scoriae TaxID=643052 RepID=A0A841BHN4_9ACTN|nr:CATRA system-associated protein [Allocatelliglobosispora scoriae]MBB5867135.1 hypothetical protein [Allocatelliglobosispora scoriae]
MTLPVSAVIDEALEVLGELTAWELTERAWAFVERQLMELAAAVEQRDVTRTQAAVLELEEVGETQRQHASAARPPAQPPRAPKEPCSPRLRTVSQVLGERLIEWRREWQAR